ncbi:MAG: flagellar assembly protein FliW [Acetobacterales bacterium]
MPAFDLYNANFQEALVSVGDAASETASGSATRAAANHSGEAATSVVVDTRFGAIEFHWDKAIYMPIGVLGFPEHHVFGLAHLPHDKLSQVKLMQCLTDPNLCFIVAPYNIDSGAIAADDLNRAAASVSIAEGELAVMLVVSVRSKDAGDGIDMSVNLQAPILIDTGRQTAWQCVLPNEAYAVQAPLA